MTTIIPIRRGDFVCYEKMFENCWGYPIGETKRAGIVVGNPRDPYTGRFCKSDEWGAVVRMQTADGEVYDAEMRHLTHIKRLEDFTREDLAQLREEVVLNSIYTADYRNSFGISDHSAYTFFDSYMEFICELAEEDGYEWDYRTFDEFLKAYDTTDNLYNWWSCYDGFDWVVYEGEEEYRQAA